MDGSAEQLCAKKSFACSLPILHQDSNLSAGWLVRSGVLSAPSPVSIVRQLPAQIRSQSIFTSTQRPVIQKGWIPLASCGDIDYYLFVSKWVNNECPKIMKVWQTSLFVGLNWSKLGYNFYNAVATKSGWTLGQAYLKIDDTSCAPHKKTFAGNEVEKTLVKTVRILARTLEQKAWQDMLLAGWMDLQSNHAPKSPLLVLCQSCVRILIWVSGDWSEALSCQRLALTL